MIISKLKSVDEAKFYCVETISNGWDRDTLELQIKKNLFQSRGRAISNFDSTLPAKQSKLVMQTLKDPYNFDFLGLYDDALEKAIEDELTKHITDFYLNLEKVLHFLDDNIE